MSDKKYKNAKKRYRRRLAKQLALSAEVVCESLDKDPERAHAALSRVLRDAIELCKDARTNEQRRDDLMEHLRDCGYGRIPYVETDEESENLLVVDGTFDLNELCKRVFWYGASDTKQLHLEEIQQCA